MSNCPFCDKPLSEHKQARKYFGMPVILCDKSDNKGGFIITDKEVIEVRIDDEE